MFKNIPTYVLAGALGAGKTTVVRHWLAQRPRNERWAVMVNEFGEIGLDAALMDADPDGISLTEVAGGCICCVNGAPFTIALSRLIRSARPDRLIIELSGLSHPMPLLTQLRAPPWEGTLALQRPVLILDAQAHLTGTPMPAHARSLLAEGCLVVFNKADQLSLLDKQAIEERLGCTGLWVNEGQLDWELVHTAAPGDALASPRARLVAMVPTASGAWSKGWTLPPSEIVDLRQLERMLAQWPWVRAKMIVNSGAGWYSANLVAGQRIAWRPSEWRNDSRLELIFAQPQDSESLTQDWANCRQKG